MSNDQEDAAAGDERERQPSKQPYTPPKLVTYGDITTLTQGNPAGGQKADGGGKAKTRTG